VGGRIDCFSCSASHRSGQRAWGWLTVLNEHHMFWAWISLLGVTSADLYVRLAATGHLHDPIFLRFGR